VTRARVARALGALALGVAIAAAARGAELERPAPPSGVEIQRLDPRLDALVPADAKLERVAEGFAWLEGPVWRSDPGALLFSDVVGNAIHEWRPGSAPRLFLAPSGYGGAERFSGREPGSNGLALDRQGRLLICQHGDRRIARLEADGTQTVLVDRFEGRRLNSPNDLVVRPNGDVVFTDPPWGLPRAFDDPARELSWSGVYRLRPDAGLELLTKELRAPNGLGFSPGGDLLYVSESDPANPRWVAFPVRSDGTLGAGRTFADGRAFAKRAEGVPDGLEVDARGNLFAAGPGGIHVFAPDGTHLGTLWTGVATSNCAFGGDGSDLYVTASDRIYRIRLLTRGPGS
jgi:gluconolactonase